MARVTRCDRCLGFTDSAPLIAKDLPMRGTPIMQVGCPMEVAIPVRVEASGAQQLPSREFGKYDLCPKCLDGLSEWFNTGMTEEHGG